MAKDDGAVNFGPITECPTQRDEKTGVYYDFNNGLRVVTPDTDVIWHLKVWNYQTGDLLADKTMPAKSLWSFPKKYFVPYHFSISDNKGNSFEHTMNLRGKKVAIKMPLRTLGDPIAYFSYFPEFQQLHQCNLEVHTRPHIIDMFEGLYENITLKNIDDATVDDVYASYYMGLFFNAEYATSHQPYDFRTYGLHQQSAHILGLSDIGYPTPPKINKGISTISGKYVVISYSGSKQCKMWNNPAGWLGVVRHLREIGYDVYCIDKDPVIGLGNTWNYAPIGAIDLTGNIPIRDRAAVISGADMFIGMASGLSWVAWACNVPVIMISGFSLPFAEFPCFRVINPYCECIGCWNDTRINFNHHEFMWCPRIDAKIDLKQEAMRKTTDEEEIKLLKEQIAELEDEKFICTKSITASHVNAYIDKVASMIAKKKEGKNQ